MSDQQQQTTEPTATDDAAQTDDQTRPTETVDFWKQKAREQEKRAKENAGAAKRLAEIEDAQKSEAEKVADRLRELESEVESARRDALRFKVASKYGIGDEDVDLFLTASDEETLTKQAERLSGRRSDERKTGNHVPREGRTPTEPPEDELRAFTRQLFTGGAST